MKSRTSRGELEGMAKALGDRDLRILKTLNQHRFLTTRQITTFEFADKPTEIAALRAANRTLAKLSGTRLVAPLERRIGGVRGGSGAFVWSIGTVGARLLQLADAQTESSRRQREIEPSTTFLAHTLAVAEVHLRLRAATRRDNLALRAVQLEPDCWRAYTGTAGGTLRLKPDLAVITESASFEDHWFIEVDMATEPPSRVIRKCEQYQEYLRTGTEQRRLGLFPAVVWIVPSTLRRDTVRQRLSSEPSISTGLFTVITLDELADLISNGPKIGRAHV